MKKFFNWMMAAILICGATTFTACSSDDDGEKKSDALTVEKLAGLWVTDYAESGTDGERTWTRTVEDYQFNADGTGYYECYRLNGEKFVNAVSVRDNGALHFTISGNTVTVTGDENNMTQTLAYADGKLTVQGKTLQKATTEQQTLVEQLYADWQAGNSGGVLYRGVTFIERSWDGTKVVEKEVSKYMPWLNDVFSSDLIRNGNILLDGYWYVTGNFETDLPIMSTGDLRIVLCDDAVLKPKCIIVEGDNIVRIYGQKRGTGQLIIDDTPHCPAIGPDKHPGGKIEINGGTITAEGSNGCAAIGGGYINNGIFGTTNMGFGHIAIYGGVINATGGGGAAGIGGSVRSRNNGLVDGYPSDGEIDIYGGEIHAQGGDYAVLFDVYGGAGIGGGCNGPVTSVNIYGGNIYAKGGSEASGIGCGENAELNYNGRGWIFIYGGNIEAHGKDHAAGIGGGDGVYMHRVGIFGGVVKAYGGVNAAAIGGGEGAQGGEIEITGGTVYAYAGADGAGIGGGEDGDGGDINISGGIVFAYGNNYSDGFGAGIGGGQDGNSGKITISGGEVHAYGGDDAAGIGTGEETTSGPNIKADNITISGGAVEAVGGGKGAGIGAGQDAEVGTITITSESGSVYVSGRAGNDCGWWAGAFGAYDEDDRGTLNIGKGVKLLSIETDYSWSTIPVALNPVAFAQQRCHVQLTTCDHPGYTAETCIFCKH